MVLFSSHTSAFSTWFISKMFVQCPICPPNYICIKVGVSCVLSYRHCWWGLASHKSFCLTRDNVNNTVKNPYIHSYWSPLNLALHFLTPVISSTVIHAACLYLWLTCPFIHLPGWFLPCSLRWTLYMTVSNYPFIQLQISLEHELCARDSARCYRYNGEHSKWGPGPQSPEARETLMKLSHTQLTFDHDQWCEGKAQAARRAYSRMTWSYMRDQGRLLRGSNHWLV